MHLIFLLGDSITRVPDLPLYFLFFLSVTRGVNTAAMGRGAYDFCPHHSRNACGWRNDCWGVHR
jgi:hypothetical protein